MTAPRPINRTSAQPEAAAPRVPPTDGSREFEDFIYLLSHDVRNSVRALVEVPQWIEEDLTAAGVDLRGPVGQNIRLMHTHTRRLDRMLADLLVYSRIGRKQQMRRVALDDAVDQVLDQITVPPGMRITRDFRVPALVMGECDVLTLLNALIGNAIRHHHRCEGVVQLSSAAEDGQIRLDIRDDGPGIAARYRERAMKAMTTLRPRDEVEGSGMGLATARKIVDLYGGQIEIVDDPDCCGTHIRMTFHPDDHLV